ncbi:MAG TPA: prepilin-type N-terminal cleavage/methylation domain-containing protein [Chthonomonadaceae bacterium]|nr:prepilin-type N-terminal cleavage/methylation domain-containing protein [Chthonomonadaceae bacterium]
MQREQSAFTLIELLVVIAIIAILAAILFPVFAQARESARQISCLSNVKQLTTAEKMYIQDYDEKYNELTNGAAVGIAQWPGDSADGDGPPPSEQLIWLGYLQPYIKNIQIAFCPSSAHSLVNSYHNLNFTGLYWRRVDRKQLPIGMIGEMAPWDDWQCVVDLNNGVDYFSSYCVTGFHSESSFTYPAQFAVFADSVPKDPGTGGGGYWADPYNGINVNFGLSSRHREGTNVGFLDGHAKWYKTSTLVAPDQIFGSGQCINYDRARVYYDPSAPLPDTQPTCEGQGLR